MRQFKLFLIGVLSIFYFQSNAQDELDFDAISLEICDCSTELIDMKDEIANIEKEEDKEKAEKLLKEYETAAIDFQNCIEVLSQKYDEIDNNKDYEKKAEQALIKNCPVLAEMLGLKPMYIKEGDKEHLEEMDIPIEELVVVEEIDIEADVEREYNEAYFEDFGIEVCSCINESGDLWSEYEKVLATNDNEKIAKFRYDTYRLYPEYHECINKVKRNYKGLDGTEEAKNKAVKALETTCPKFIQLSGAK